MNDLLMFLMAVSGFAALLVIGGLVAELVLWLEARR